MMKVEQQDHAPENGRFVLFADGKEVGEMTYTYAGERKAAFDHTYIHPDYRGGRSAALLMDAAMDWVRQRDLTIFPLCSYVEGALRRFPDKYGDIHTSTIGMEELTGEIQPCDVARHQTE
jgi:predicted GNAT family acetyltransferase